MRDTRPVPDPPPRAVAIRRIRDLLILDGALVIASDSVGGIGPKPADTIPASAQTVAHFALRVPLLEVICSGAQPIAVVNDLCVELEPTGRQMIEEIRRLATEAGISPDAVTGSTEDNVVTQATGVGVTVLGRTPADGLLSGRGRAGDIVLCAGLPLSAPRDDVRIGHPGQVSVAAVTAVIASGLVHDALPVGSKGVAWEVGQLADSAGLAFELLDPGEVSLTASGGPASCVLLSCDPGSLDAVTELLGPGTPVRAIARLLPHAP